MRVGAIGLALLVVGAASLGCADPADPTDARGAARGAATSTSPTPGAIAPAPPDGGEVPLAALAIDDGPPPSGYLRDLFPTWKDVDHDGCDARRQALIAASTTPAETGPRCSVISGTWASAYDGVTTTDPGEVQIDHVVPLANAWRSGADRWETDRRTRFANDQSELWAVSAAANQSKGDGGPERWRPPDRSVWCTYATRWIGIKVGWDLTATTPERDVLGQMLETCPDPGRP